MPAQIQTPSTRAEDFTFGVEIECFVPRNCPINAGAYHRGNDLPQTFPAGWEAQRDGSLRTERRNFKAVEIVSPILKGADGINEVLEVARLLREMGGFVNRTCGFHIHVGAKSAAGENADDVAGWVSNLINLMGQHEIALYASTGSRYRAACRYAESIKEPYTESRRKELKKKKWDVLRREVTGIDRYRTLNLANLLDRGKMTVEFRVFAGTLNPTKILGYIQLCLGLCEKALGVAVPFKAPKTRIYRGGDGLKGLNRLFYLLGWSLGRKDVGQPTCNADGWLVDLGQLPAVKKELRRLARKFDSQS